jgi:hypothetical protein
MYLILGCSFSNNLRYFSRFARFARFSRFARFARFAILFNIADYF